MMKTEKETLCQLVQLLQKEGFSDVRFYLQHTRRFGVNVFEGKQENTVRADDRAYFVEAGKNGKRCCTFFNHLDDLQGVVEQMQLSALASQEEYNPTLAIAQPQDFAQSWEEPQEQVVVDRLIEAEQAARKETKISCVDHCGYQETWQEITLMDEQGNTLTDSSRSATVSVSVVSRENGDTEIANGQRSVASLAEMDAVSLAQQVAQLGADRLHSKPIVSGNYAVILKNDAAAELLEAYLPVFYASELQNQMSALGNQQGQQVAAQDLELIEDPQYPQGRVHRHFDDEGTPVSRKYLLKDGAFVCALYNRKSASKEEKSSTGNGFKSDVSSAVGTGVTNVLLQSASGSYCSMEQLCAKMKDGLIVTGLEGVFAGVNTINGRFSLLCKGMVVENGKQVKPFCEVTIAGSIGDLLRDVVALGDDPAPTAAGSQFLQTPSILLKKLAVSGL